MNTLDELRQKIDQIDAEMTHLLEKRFDLVEEVAKVKKNTAKATYDPSREEAVIAKLPIKNPEFRAPIVATFRDIMRHSREFQETLKK